jgi:tetratricopeptide (TPR) repeat protein/predicted Ser/Thr protein kinase
MDETLPGDKPTVTDGAPPIPGSDLRPDPTRIGRHVVIERLGEGGMGVVYAAYDPQLDRKLAVKLVRTAMHDSRGTSDPQARLLREAQAMARLSHPNVIQVYDAGTHEGQVYIAMEFVDGEPLGKWMRRGESPRPWREVIDVLSRAGRGLAAAHSAGLVHRDFKPDNVLVGKDGSVRVLDFGLVRRTDLEADGEAPTPSEGASLTPRGTQLTRAGFVVGTPAYMAPEQFADETADARTDQFSFCVSLYQALYGLRPFAGDTAHELAYSVTEGELREPPKQAHVPGWVRRVVMRGLSKDPAQRFPTMGALLVALANDPARMRARATGAVAVTGLAAFAIWAALRDPAPTVDPLAHLCKGATDKLAGIWDDTRKQTVQEAFLATDLAYAPGAYEGFSAALDRYAHGWVKMHTEACEATSIRGEQSEELMDLRMACLGERLVELRALVDVYTKADAKAVDKAGQAAGSIPGIDRCADVEALVRQVPPPEDPETRERLDEVRAQVAMIKAEYDAGHPKKAYELSGPAVEAATELGYEPLRAEALYYRGSVEIATGKYKEANDTLQESFLVALGSKRDDILAKAATVKMFVLGAALAKKDEADEWYRQAEAAVRRGGTGGAAEAQLLNTHGLLLGMQAKHDEAIASYERAFEIREKVLGPEHPHLAYTVGNLAIELVRKGRLDEARDYVQRALDILRKTEGPQHPHVANNLNTLGVILRSQGKLEEARATHEEALSIRESSLGREHAETAGSLGNLGTVLMDLGDYEAAVENMERALAIEEKRHGPDHPTLVGNLTNLANALRRLGRHDEARTRLERGIRIADKTGRSDHPEAASAHNSLGTLLRAQGKLSTAQRSHERALAIWKRKHGEDHPDVADALYQIGKDLLEQKRNRPALERFQRALAIHEKAHGKEHARVLACLNGVAQAHVALGEPGQAIELLERALAMPTPSGAAAIEHAHTRFLAAQALWDLDRDRNRAVRLAHEAKNQFGSAPKGTLPSPTQAKLDAWLTAHADAG